MVVPPFPCLLGDPLQIKKDLFPLLLNDLALKARRAAVF